MGAHTLAQRVFTILIENGFNPTDKVFEIKKGKVMTTSGREVNGYDLSITELDAFVEEKFRPSLESSEEQSYVWAVPEEIVEFLKDKDGDPITMIDLFLLLKENFPAIDEKEMKKYAVKLCEHNVLSLRNVRTKWI